MHELSIAKNILETVQEHVPAEKRSRISKVTMEIGAASGVVADALVFAFDAIVHDTPMRNAALDTVIIPFSVMCHECRRESQNESGYMTCMFCDSPNVTVLSGTEMVLKQIELNDE
jgi:hydrogenase nickel incorporation protein HypA/HybF